MNSFAYLWVIGSQFKQLIILKVLVLIMQN